MKMATAAEDMTTLVTLVYPCCWAWWFAWRWRFVDNDWASSYPEKRHVAHVFTIEMPGPEKNRSECMMKGCFFVATMPSSQHIYLSTHFGRCYEMLPFLHHLGPNWSFKSPSKKSMQPCAAQTWLAACEKLEWRIEDESWSYCWWLKSCTSWYVVFPIIYRVSYIPGSAGFQPSTVFRGCVCLVIFYGLYHRKSLNFAPPFGENVSGFYSKHLTIKSQYSMGFPRCYLASFRRLVWRNSNEKTNGWNLKILIVWKENHCRYLHHWWPSHSISEPNLIQDRWRSPTTNVRETSTNYSKKVTLFSSIFYILYTHCDVPPPLLHSIRVMAYLEISQNKAPTLTQNLSASLECWIGSPKKTCWYKSRS